MVRLGGKWFNKVNEKYALPRRSRQALNPASCNGLVNAA
jgi:hypothetical protein